MSTNLLKHNETLSAEMLKVAAAKARTRAPEALANLSRILLPIIHQRQPSKNTGFYNVVAFWPLFARTIE
jgi:hypothetical protein